MSEILMSLSTVSKGLRWNKTYLIMGCMAFNDDLCASKKWLWNDAYISSDQEALRKAKNRQRHKVRIYIGVDLIYSTYWSLQ